MTAPARRRLLAPWLLAPLAVVPVVAWLLMEYGPERSFLFAAYLLVYAIAFLAAGVAVAMRRPSASAKEVLVRAATWALLIFVVGFAALLVLSMVYAPGTP
ncbi:MAG TPA: hypothetical protein VFS59_00595 [Gemmatimonadaceae bacterium]|nr:hypothetical protein [Gemmatimonadaceae bacterium]